MKVHQPPEDMKGKPLISESNPDMRYLGRIIVELWEQPVQPDEPAFAYTYDKPPTNLNRREWLMFLSNTLRNLAQELEKTANS